MDEWVPPITTAEEMERLTKIESGFPDYMIDQVRAWILQACTSGGYWSVDVPEALSRHLKTRLPSDFDAFSDVVRKSGSDTLAILIDCLLFHNLGEAQRLADWLGGILDEGRAGWSITTDDWGRPRLTHRIPAGVRESFEQTMSASTLAGMFLSDAFECAYGASANPGHAYTQSVKAVEAVAIPAFLPENRNATLGRVIQYLNSKDVSLPLREKNASHRSVVVGMMQTLWEGVERHAGQEGYKDVTVPGAKAAHSLAVALVQMIHEGLVSAK